MDQKLLRVIGIGGLPATGKSSLVLSAVRQLGGWGLFRAFAIGAVRGYVAADHQLMLLGVYDQRGFPGTDRLSMNVQDAAIDLIHGMVGNRSMNICRILFEGESAVQPLFRAAGNRQPANRDEDAHSDGR
jgi:hypothetical protein